MYCGSYLLTLPKCRGELVAAVSSMSFPPLVFWDKSIWACIGNETFRNHLWSFSLFLFSTCFELNCKSFSTIFEMTEVGIVNMRIFGTDNKDYTTYHGHNFQPLWPPQIPNFLCSCRSCIKLFSFNLSFMEQVFSFPA